MYFYQWLLPNQKEGDIYIMLLTNLRVPEKCQSQTMSYTSSSYRIHDKKINFKHLFMLQVTHFQAKISK